MPYKNYTLRIDYCFYFICKIEPFKKLINFTKGLSPKVELQKPNQNKFNCYELITPKPGKLFNTTRFSESKVKPV
jgi:hypothetical protein